MIRGIATILIGSAVTIFGTWQALLAVSVAVSFYYAPTGDPAFGHVVSFGYVGIAACILLVGIQVVRKGLGLIKLSRDSRMIENAHQPGWDRLPAHRRSPNEKRP